MVSYDLWADQTFVSVLCGSLLISTDDNESPRHRDWAAALAVRCSNPGKGKRFFFNVLQTVQTGNWAHLAFRIVGTGDKADAAWSCHLCLASRFRMSGAVRLLPFRAFMAWTGRTLRLATDTSSLYCPLLKRILFTYTAWVEFLDTSDEGRERTYRSWGRGTVIWPCSHLSFDRCFLYKKPKVKFMHSCSPVEQYR
jgi:hypothetical protein